MEDKTINELNIEECENYYKPNGCGNYYTKYAECNKNKNCIFKKFAKLRQENIELKDILKYASEYSYIMRAYILDVKRTMPYEFKKQDRINNICYGLGGETGEILDYLKKVFYHKQVFNPKILSEEIGDLFWYICALMYEYDLDFTQILRQNIEKRKKRYPNGFNPLDSLLRKDKDNE